MIEVCCGTLIMKLFSYRITFNIIADNIRLSMFAMVICFVLHKSRKLSLICMHATISISVFILVCTYLRVYHFHGYEFMCVCVHVCVWKSVNFRVRFCVCISVCVYCIFVLQLLYETLNMCIFLNAYRYVSTSICLLLYMWVWTRIYFCVIIIISGLIYKYMCLSACLYP